MGNPLLPHQLLAARERAERPTTETIRVTVGMRDDVLAYVVSGCMWFQWDPLPFGEGDISVKSEVANRVRWVAEPGGRDPS